MKDDVKAFVAGAVFLMLVFSVITIDLTGLWSGATPRVTIREGMSADPAGPEDPKGLAQFMFGAYALPFEVLSVVLLVALVGALVLAKPETGTEDEP